MTSNPRPDWRMPQARDVQVLGHRIRYWETGAGAPIVLVHGFSGNATFEWGRVMHLLAERHRVIALQVIGFAPSQQPDMAYTTDALVEHLSAFMKALKLEKVTLVGESFGGWHVAAYAALQARPGSPLAPIAKLVVVAGAICIEKPMRENPRGFVDDAVAAEVEKLIARDPNFDNEPIKARILKESDLGKRHPTAEELSRISVPTLLLWGDKDEHIPLDCAERAAKIIPGANSSCCAMSGTSRRSRCPTTSCGSCRSSPASVSTP